ncbi:MAG: SBBP repeat-containing protein, partial [bacterium]
MSRLIRVLTLAGVFIFATFSVCGCQGGNNNPPVIPENPSQDLAITDQQESPGFENSHYLWGYYLVKIDPESLEADIIPVREVSMHVNILKFLEQGPCTDCFKIAKISQGPGGTYDIDISIKHPFVTPLLTGFDVRGIAMFNGSKVFPVSGLRVSDSSLGDCELMNPDGFTTLYNPETIDHGPLEGYLKGKLATATLPNATLNGYKRFISIDPANTRNAFYADDTITVTYNVKLSGPVIFDYAIDASWAPAINKPVTDPMTDFPISANCPEPWKIKVSDLGPALTELGGTTELQIDVYDHQGKDDKHPVVLECPDLFDGEVTATWKEDSEKYTRYEAEIGNVKLASGGSYPCLISKEAKENDPAGKPWLDLTAYQVFNVCVLIGWARTWGGSSNDEGYDVAVDGSGNAYVAGKFVGTVDFDPGPGVENRRSTCGERVFPRVYI